MIQGLQKKIDDSAAWRAALVLGGAALVLLLAHAIQPDGVLVGAGAAYIVAAGGILLMDYVWPHITTRMALLVGGVAGSAALLLTLRDSAGMLNIGAGLALLMPLTTARHLTMRDIAAHGSALLLVLAVGTLLVESVSGAFLPAAALLIVGHGGALLSAREQATASSASAHTGAKANAAEDLAELSMRMHVAVDGLVRAAQAINQVVQQQSAGADEQAEIISAMNSHMDTFLAQAEQIKEQARSVTETTSRAAQMSEEGQTALNAATESMDQIRQHVEAIAATIVTLAQLARRIETIIASVTEIATQSNLLALNASIEAARAGTQGRGFAVVAEEVRSLSQQSSDAARQVQSLLGEIQSAVGEAREATEAGVAGVDAGVERAQEANAVLVSLTEAVNASDQAIHAIYRLIGEQANGMDEISISMDRIDRITQQNLTSTRTAETVSTNLGRLADDLKQSVDLGRRAANASSEDSPSGAAGDDDAYAAGATPGSA